MISSAYSVTFQASKTLCVVQFNLHEEGVGEDGEERSFDSAL